MCPRASRAGVQTSRASPSPGRALRPPPRTSRPPPTRSAPLAFSALLVYRSATARSGPCPQHQQSSRQSADARAGGRTDRMRERLSSREPPPLIDRQQPLHKLLGRIGDPVPRMRGKVELDRARFLGLRDACACGDQRTVHGGVLRHARGPGLTSALGSVCLYGNRPPSRAKQTTPKLQTSAC